MRHVQIYVQNQIIQGLFTLSLFNRNKPKNSARDIKQINDLCC